MLDFTLKKNQEGSDYLMDCLNSRLAKKDLSAFYTPMPYAQKAVELVQKAVERVPDGNDYIILENIRPKMAQLNASRMCA